MDDAPLSPLSLLGHPLRVAVLRLLVRKLPRPVAAGDIALALGVPPSTLSAHLAGLAGAGVLALRKDGPLRLYHAVPDRLGDAMDWLARDVCLGRAGQVADRPIGMPRVLFLCDDNAALSVMAEAIGEQRLAGRAMVVSAGLTPTDAFNPVALAMLNLRGQDPGHGRPEGLGHLGGAEIVIALTARAAEALPVFADPLPVCAVWPLDAPRPGGVIPTATALHRAYRALNTRIAAMRRLPLARLPRHAIQAALDDLSSGLREGGHVCGSLPEPRRRSPAPALAASEAS